MGHRPRGLQRRRQRVGVLLARPVALARVPLGRRRPRRDLRRQAAALLRARAVERARSDPEGAALRTDQQRGQSRRGREGILLLRRQHAHALVHEVPVQVSAAGVPLSRPHRHQPWQVEGSVRVRAARHGRIRRGPVLRRVRGIRQGRSGRRPDPHRGSQPRARVRQASRPADPVVPQHVVVGRRHAQAIAARRRRCHDPGVTPRPRRLLAVVRG